MKNILKYGVFSLVAAFGLILVGADSADAQNRREARREYRRDRGEARREYSREVREARREYRDDIRDGDNRREARREYRGEVRDARRDYRDDVRDARRERVRNATRYNNGWYYYNSGRRIYRPSTQWYYRNGYFYRRY